MGGHEVSPEVGFLTAQQGRKIAIIPFWIREHFTVNAQNQLGSLRGVIAQALIPEPGEDRQPASFDSVLQGVANAIDRAGKARCRSLNRLHLHAGPCGSGKEARAKVHPLPTSEAHHLEGANRSICVETGPNVFAGQDQSGISTRWRCEQLIPCSLRVRHYYAHTLGDEIASIHVCLWFLVLFCKYILLSDLSKLPPDSDGRVALSVKFGISLINAVVSCLFPLRTGHSYD